MLLPLKNIGQGLQAKLSHDDLYAYFDCIRGDCLEIEFLEKNSPEIEKLCNRNGHNKGYIADRNLIYIGLPAKLLDQSTTKDPKVLARGLLCGLIPISNKLTNLIDEFSKMTDLSLESAKGDQS